uniref:Putative secreted protein n=1 Tax=Ixodes ricinus TaxID=34613 RepID=A0A6B0UCN1_IXORI
MLGLQTGCGQGVPVSIGLVVLVALPTAAVLPQAEGAPHPRTSASPKAGNISFPRLRHLEENDPGGHKDLVAEGPTFWANHVSCWSHIDWCFANPEDNPQECF